MLRWENAETTEPEEKEFAMGGGEEAMGDLPGYVLTGEEPQI